MNFDSERYGPAVVRLLEVSAPYPLVPKRPVAQAKGQLAALDDAAMFGDAKIADRDMADACRSGLWLLFDFLDPSHRISQEIHTATGSFWHGIMHRREPDWSNAKYWYRQVGDHPVYDDLFAAASDAAAAAAHAGVKALLDGGCWDPFLFVDLCQQADRDGGTLETYCQTVQRAEWQLLFDYCYNQARA